MQAATKYEAPCTVPQVQAIKDLLPAVLRGLQTPEKMKRGQLVDEWPKITGPKIAQHTKPVYGPNGELYVWVDESALAFELNQKYRRAFLKRIQAVLGEGHVKSIRFRVGELR